MSLTRPRVGLVGAGQLARMTWQDAISLEIDLVCLGAPGDAAITAGATLLEGSGHRPEDLARLAEACDVLSFEIELVDLDAVAALEAAGTVVRPSAEVMRLAVDKLHQRRVLSGTHGLKVPRYAEAPDLDAVDRFGVEHGWPLVLKARTGGYDGRGVWMCPDRAAAAEAFMDAAQGGLELYVEEAVDLAAEAAIIVARAPSGRVVAYPLVDTVQVDGMCREVVLPARLPDAIAMEADTIARTLAKQIGLEGVMAIELFITRSADVLINELALRAHNTGHIHTEAAVTSQFEQHLRAILDLPLGDAQPITLAAAMVNIVGPADGSDPATRLPEALGVQGAHVHLYGKSARPGRKLGHVTVCASDADVALGRARSAADSLEGNG